MSGPASPTSAPEAAPASSTERTKSSNFLRRRSPPAPEASAASSLLRKIKLPFHPRTAAQIQHEIELDQPFRHYAPGETVCGAVHVHVARPMRATHLIVRLLGYVKVSQHARLSGEPLLPNEALLVAGSSPSSPEYLGGGCMRLFSDEAVLCGDGRLLGQYHFRFELEFPKAGLPSSIEFENGSISYLVVSTLTRPTSIAPTLRREIRVHFRETIDVAALPVPAPQRILMEAIKKRKAPLGLHRTVSAVSDVSRSQLSTRSGASGNSSIVSLPAEVVHDSIKARAEILKGGFLSGESISIRVVIEHTKAIKSMQGLVASLYRLAVVDPNPDIPRGSSGKMEGKARDDAGFRSAIGLNGSVSRRVFRQDLAQSITPVLIDPLTLTGTIRTSVKIPDNAFPTIKSVPSSIVSFRYFVEIIVDLRGKIGQDTLLQKFNMTSAAQHAYGGPQLNVVEGTHENTFSASAGFHYLITDQLRRQKGVFSTSTEIIVGTTDSARTKPMPSLSTSSHDVKQPLAAPQPSSASSTEEVLQMEEPNDEKTRLRRFEEALLPSAPPEQDNPAPAYTLAPPISPAVIGPEVLVGISGPSELEPSDAESSMQSIICQPPINDVQNSMPPDLDQNDIESTVHQTIAVGRPLPNSCQISVPMTGPATLILEDAQERSNDHG